MSVFIFYLLWLEGNIHVRAFLSEEDNSLVYTVDSMNQRHTIRFTIPLLLLYVYMCVMSVCGCNNAGGNKRSSTLSTKTVLVDKF